MDQLGPRHVGSPAIMRQRERNAPFRIVQLQILHHHFASLLDDRSLQPGILFGVVLNSVRSQDMAGSVVHLQQLFRTKLREEARR